MFALSAQSEGVLLYDRTFPEEMPHTCLLSPDTEPTTN